MIIKTDEQKYLDYKGFVGFPKSVVPHDIKNDNEAR